MKTFPIPDMDLCSPLIYYHSNFEPEGEAGAEATTPVTTTTTATMIFKRETGKRNGIQSTHPKARSTTWYVSGANQKGPEGPWHT
jgi:hypothetical protein